MYEVADWCVNTNLILMTVKSVTVQCLVLMMTILTMIWFPTVLLLSLFLGSRCLLLHLKCQFCIRILRAICLNKVVTMLIKLGLHLNTVSCLLSSESQVKSRKSPESKKKVKRERKT